jgi:hypothetical protein
MNLIPNTIDSNIDSSDVSQLELLINATLPDDYKAFLLQTNGGKVLGGGFFNIWSGTVSIQGKVVDSSGVVDFLSLNRNEANSIYENISNTGRRYPTGMLPIATDAAGNVVHLGLHDPYRGVVLFWYHDGIPSWLEMDDMEQRLELEQTSVDYLFFVSHTFTQFLNSLGAQ